jgi:hypothetical protein
VYIYNIHAIWVAFWAPRNSGIPRGDAALGKQVDEEGRLFFFINGLVEGKIFTGNPWFLHVFTIKYRGFL